MLPIWRQVYLPFSWASRQYHTPCEMLKFTTCGCIIFQFATFRKTMSSGIMSNSSHYEICGTMIGVSKPQHFNYWTNFLVKIYCSSFSTCRAECRMRPSLCLRKGVTMLYCNKETKSMKFELKYEVLLYFIKMS